MSSLESNCSAVTIDEAVEAGSSGEDEVADDASTSKNPKPDESIKVDKPLGSYQRKILYKRLRDEGSSQRTYDGILKKYKITKGSLRSYLNKSAKKYQNIARMKYTNKTYCNAASIIDFMSKSDDYAEEYEAGCVVKAIEVFEEHPDPEETENIDFKDIYRFLGDAMMGKPTRDLSEESAAFLTEQFLELMEEVNSTKGEEDSKIIMESLENSERLFPPLEERLKE